MNHDNQHVHSLIDYTIEFSVYYLPSQAELNGVLFFDTYHNDINTIPILSCLFFN